MKNIKISLSGILLLLIALASCNEDILGPMGKLGDNPSPVLNAIVENLPGAAKITYDVPKNTDLLYVKAEYEALDGTKHLESSSVYTNSLLIEGFGDTLEHEVKLYSVSRSEKISEPLIVKVKPLLAPVYEVFETLALREDFGGINVRFQNNRETNVAIFVMVKDSVGDWTPIDTYYTKSKEGSFSVRGLPVKEKEFGVYVRDRWNNKTEIVSSVFTPLEESLIDRNYFKPITNLPTDTYLPHTQYKTWSMDKLWDGKTGTTNSIFHTNPNTGLPQWFTFDLGKDVLLSRFKMHHNASSAATYNQGTPKKFEIWGTDSYNPDGSWDSWTKLMDCESFKPSGSAVGTNTNDDKQYAVVDGEDFTFPMGTPRIRYIRFKTLETWGGLGNIVIGELTFWGQGQ